MRVDKKSVELIKRGDRGTTEAVYLSYYKLVKYKIYEIVKSNEDAEDIAQDVFVKAFMHIDSYDTRVNFATWIIAVARNAAIDHLRKRKLEVEYVEDVSVLSAADEDDGGDDLDARIKQLLTEEEYTIVTYKIYFDFKFTDIARMMGSNLAVVTGKYYRAIRKLQKGLREDTYD